MIKMLLCEVQGGIYHFCGDEEVCWSEFAEHIFKVAAEMGAISRMPKVSKITSEQYVTLAKRPKYSTLSCNKINEIGIPASNWQSALEYVISRLRKWVTYKSNVGTVWVSMMYFVIFMLTRQ